MSFRLSIAHEAPNIKSNFVIDENYEIRFDISQPKQRASKSTYTASTLR